MAMLIFSQWIVMILYWIPSGMSELSRILEVTWIIEFILIAYVNYGLPLLCFSFLNKSRFFIEINLLCIHYTLPKMGLMKYTLLNTTKWVLIMEVSVPASWLKWPPSCFLTQSKSHFCSFGSFIFISSISGDPHLRSLHIATCLSAILNKQAAN